MLVRAVVGPILAANGAAGMEFPRLRRKTGGVRGDSSCLRAALSGNGLRQSGIVFLCLFCNAALEGPLFHGAATVCGETDCRNSRFLTGPLARFGMTSIMAAIGARWRSPKAPPPYGKWTRE